MIHPGVSLIMKLLSVCLAVIKTGDVRVSYWPPPHNVTSLSWDKQSTPGDVASLAEKVILADIRDHFFDSRVRIWIARSTIFPKYTSSKIQTTYKLQKILGTYFLFSSYVGSDSDTETLPKLFTGTDGERYLPTSVHILLILENFASWSWQSKPFSRYSFIVKFWSLVSRCVSGQPGLITVCCIYSRFV